ncbi:MAG TPA: hypothetical protein VHW24_13175 [Bryobacteraceae bacterium]|jgi:Rod binding domain-containing protein|nr:hypothetical protein [Bryobacteraceae bacterium]
MTDLTMSAMANAAPRIPEQKSFKSDSPAKIKDAAQQFESLLLTQMLSSVHEGGGWLGTGSDQAGGAASGFAEQQLASMIAQKGGLGLSQMIQTGLAKQSGGQATPSGATTHGAKPPSHP